jgi:hypothetical protein
MPTERPLTEDERTEIEAAAGDAIAAHAPDGGDLVDLIRAVERAATSKALKTDEDVFAAGALVAGCFEMGLGFELVEVDFDGKLTALAVVELDRSLAILPFHAIDQVMRAGPADLLSTTYARLESGERPPGLARRGYAVLVP